MGHFAKIGGTAYEIVGGKTLIDGVEREIVLGRTVVDGVGFDIPFTIKITINFNSSTSSGQGYIAVDGQTYSFDDQEKGSSLTVRVPHGSEVYAYVGYNSYGSSYIYFNDELVAGQAMGYPAEQDYSFAATSDLDVTFNMTSGSQKYYNRIYIEEV